MKFWVILAGSFFIISIASLIIGIIKELNIIMITTFSVLAIVSSIIITLLLNRVLLYIQYNQAKNRNFLFERRPEPFIVFMIIFIISISFGFGFFVNYKITKPLIEEKDRFIVEQKKTFEKKLYETTIENLDVVTENLKKSIEK